MEKTCAKCGGPLEAGYTHAMGLIRSEIFEGRAGKLLFIVPGAESSWNPLEAFKQGLADEPSDRAYRIHGFRCASCGALELYANALDE